MVERKGTGGAQTPSTLRPGLGELNVRVQYSLETSLNRMDGDPYDYVTSMRGVISADDDQMGELRVTLLHLDHAVNDGVSTAEVFDITSDLHEFYYALVMSKSRRAWEGFGDILIIDRLGLLPQFRGHGLGLLAIAKTAWVFSGCELVAINPSPLRYDPGAAHTFEPCPDDAVKARLGRYYSRLGFKQVARHGIWTASPNAIVSRSELASRA